MANISDRIFYLQSIYNVIETTGITMMYVYIDEMRAFSTNYAVTKTQIFRFTMAWIALSLLIGMTVIWILKTQYFNEAYMITFLNN
jgi:hypothetical protein